MRLARTALWIVAIGAAGIWLLGLAHGFKGVYCFNSTHTCTSQDIEFHGNVVVWLAPVVFVVSLWLLRVIRRYMSAHYVGRMAAQQSLLERRAASYPDDADSDGTDTTTASRPRHATSSDPGTGFTSIPRHAAPEDQVEYEISALTPDQRVRLARLLDATGVPYSVSGRRQFLVDREHESKVDSIFDSLPVDLDAEGGA